METKMNTSLSEMQRKNAFTVPIGYFEELPTAVLSKCSVSKVQKQSLRTSKPLWWSVAACLVLLLGIWFVVPDKTSSLDSSLSKSEFFDPIDHFNDYLSLHLSTSVLEDALFSANADLTFDLDFTHEEALAYLDYHNIYHHNIIE